MKAGDLVYLFDPYYNKEEDYLGLVLTEIDKEGYQKVLWWGNDISFITEEMDIDLIEYGSKKER